MKNFVRTLGIAAAIATGTGLPAGAHAQSDDLQQATQELGQCLVESTTGRDRILIARWMAAALASSPKMEGLIAVDADAKKQVDQQMGAVFSRLMAKDCLPQARTLVAFRSPQAMEAAGGKLGEVAMRELMTDPATMAALLEYINYVDQDAITALTP